MAFDSTTRLRHGHAIEDAFRTFMKERPDWEIQDMGQRHLPIEQQMRDRQIFIPFETEKGQEFLNCLPAEWRDVYRARLKDKGIPSAKRYVPDFLCKYKNVDVIDVDVKSEIGNYPNITFELSGYGWSVLYKFHNLTDKVFVFPLGKNCADWYYLFLEQIPSHTVRIIGGENCGGSGTPFGLIPKASLTQKFTDLLSYHETMSEYTFELAC